MTEDDPYADLKRHSMTPEIQATLVMVPGKVQKRREHFVRVPWTWVERLTNARHTATYRVALFVLYRHWKGGGKPFTLSNTAVEDQGVSRWTKWAALGELEQLGLITVERRVRRSPKVTVHETPHVAVCCSRMLLFAVGGMIFSNMPPVGAYGL